MQNPTPETESWRPVVGCEGVYEVSDLGRVRRIGRAARTGKGRGGGVRLGRVLKVQPRDDGYVSVQLWLLGKPSNRLVHLVVAEAFLGPIPDGMEVNHIDGIKANCRADNLEYLTHSGNMKHSYRTGLRAVTVEQMARARRKPRLMVPCDCGCGELIETPDRKGRDRRYVSGHNMRSAT